MTEAREALRVKAFNLTPDDQFWLASMVAENVGYVLVPETQLMTPIEDRVARLEAAVHELNPGWQP